MRVYCVGSRTAGTGGFDWFYSKEDADQSEVQEIEATQRFRDAGERYEIYHFEHETKLTDAEAITQEIDDQLFDYEEAAGIA